MECSRNFMKFLEKQSNSFEIFRNLKNTGRQPSALITEYPFLMILDHWGLGFRPGVGALFFMAQHMPEIRHFGNFSPRVIIP